MQKKRNHQNYKTIYKTILRMLHPVVHAMQNMRFVKERPLMNLIKNGKDVMDIKCIMAFP